MSTTQNVSDRVTTTSMAHRRRFFWSRVGVASISGAALYAGAIGFLFVPMVIVASTGLFQPTFDTPQFFTPLTVIVFIVAWALVIWVLHTIRRNGARPRHRRP